MLDLIKEIISTLALVAGAAALVLFLLAVGAALVDSYRVGYRRRPLVLTFGGTDDSRVALTVLFAMQLMRIEQEWVSLANAVIGAKERFNQAFEASSKTTEFPAEQTRTPLTDGADLPNLRSDTASTDPNAVGVGPRSVGAAVGLGPRSVGDETIDFVLDLQSDQNSLGDPDLGTVSVAGVSFSPQAILALLRRLPAACARRRISGTLGRFGDTAIIAATYEERAWRKPTSSAQRLVTVDGDWLAAIETLAFRLGKGRLEVINAQSDPAAAAGGSRSETAERGFIEAESWEAAKAFLVAYERHFRHFTSGTAADRDSAIELYEAAIERQPGYTRAHYNRGTLLYNRYRGGDNKQAIEDFEQATKSDHDRLRALAFAGIAMACGQQVHRFDVDKDEVAAKAREASEQALHLGPDLEESWLAAAWALQIDERWSEAKAAYLDVLKLESTSIPGRRIKSFAYNNAGWITLKQLPGDREPLRQEAERLLWEAVALYPNKIAYANLAEVARQHRRYDDAETLFDYAVMLDPSYVNGWHEYALLELERAARSPKRRGLFRERSARYQANAERASDGDERARIKKAYEKASSARGLQAATV